MKKIYLTLLIALIVHQVSFGQWATNGDHINNTNIGNVGIGTSSPLSLLHVKSSLPTPFCLERDGTAANVNIQYKSPYSSVYAGIGKDGAFAVGPSADLYSQSVFNVLPAGNVGVGFNSPAQRLSVNSGNSAPTTRNLNNSITIGTGNANSTNKFLGQIGFASYDVDFSSPKIVAFISGEATEYYDNDTKTGSVMRFFTGSNAGTSPVERMVIDNAGNVGIGTTAPADKLSVNGNIRAKEIKVETANWPDYVFAKGYSLPSLAETERHIRGKGHLPGIPSAAEVTEKGIELGEMKEAASEDRGADPASD